MQGLMQARMRTAAALVVVFAALLAGAGCGDSNGMADKSTPPAPAALTPAAPPATGGVMPTLGKIKLSGVLKWGADADGGAPFVFHDDVDNNKIVGFEMDFMTAFAKRMGVKEERVQGQWDSLIDNLKSRRTDMVVNGIEINDERKKVVAFSEPYFIYEQQLTVRVGDKDTYKSLADLKGHKIAVLGGAEAEHVLERAGFTADQIAKYDDSQTPYQELEIKRVDAVVQESIIAAHYAGKNAALYNVPETFSPGRYAITVRLEDTSLLVEANRVLAEMKSSGELAAIYTKWHIMNDKQKEIGVVTK